ncbi:extracellular endo-alpha-(1-_5)-L-arabinanase 1 precursor [mine drainage metagenome]|uniref:Extracellular endo-alpha-(1->5)-L-arabinanase 1 n=1 Tax=mine drainage metagenome TaxID=410659 RepID=A0A1J5SW05_9ZZZZ
MNTPKKYPLAALLGAALSAFFLLVSPASAATWSLSGDLNCHDPAIIKEGSTWWIGRTWGAGIGIDWSSNGTTWNTGIPIFQSGLSWWTAYNGNSTWTWAPSFADYNGKTLCYYAVSTFGSKTSAIGLATATSIATGDWADQGAIITSSSSTSYNAIDPCFTLDASGNPWLSFGSWSDGLHVVALSPTTFKPTGASYNIAYNSQGIENSQIVYRSGYYYLFASVGTCCNGASSTYHIVVGRSTSITGPYYDQSGVDMMNGGGTTVFAGGGRYIAPGGESILDTGNDTWICAYHQLDSANNYATVLFINDLYWVDGWPSFSTTPTYYKFGNRTTGLDIDGLGQTANGSTCGQWSSSTSTNQQWEMVPSGTYVRLKNRATGLFLDGMGLTTNGSNAGQWSSSTSTNQQWLEVFTGGYVRFQNRATGLFLDGMGRTTNGSALGQWQSNVNYNQQWSQQPQ